MSFLQTHLSEALMIGGILLLIIEMLVLGFSTFILFFLGLSLLLSGLIMSASAVPETLISAMWLNSVLTSLLAILLWKPLKRMQQNKGEPNEIKSDFIGQEFILEDDVDLSGNSTRLYSGVSWSLKSKTPIAKGSQVRVVKADVGVLWVDVLEPES